jgi:hypothetical protein
MGGRIRRTMYAWHGLCRNGGYSQDAILGIGWGDRETRSGAAHLTDYAAESPCPSC